jgi:prephenate dehydratase
MLERVMPSKKEVAYLGPVGTYSHLVAEKKYGKGCQMVPLPTVLDVCAYVSRKPGRHGIVPIENSSGGAIYETVDILLANKPRIRIDEELTLDVQLALMGHKGQPVRSLYSHFAPLEHCVSWIRKHLPRVKKQVVTSTAVAAQRAAADLNAAALGSRKLAGIYGLDVLEYPVKTGVPNVTVFLAISGRKTIGRVGDKTTLAVKLPNEPGSLCTLLEAFRDQDVNLSRIISRPIRGCPREYAFLVDIEGSPRLAAVRQALATARKTCVQLRIVGSYSSHRPYKS